MKTSCAVRNRILELCIENDLTINKLAKIPTVPQATLKSILNGESKNPRIVNIKKLCDCFGITLRDFFNTPEFDKLDQKNKKSK